MSLLRKLFHYRKPPDGLLEISERLYVFDCCFTSDSWEEKSYKGYLAGIVSQLHAQFPDAALLVFNFRKAEVETSISKIMLEYDMTIMDYPRHYEGCPILSMELIHHFLRSTESWLALGPQNVLLLHCERGGWPVLAFMLAALLIYRKQYTGEQRTLDMVYKQAPRELLPLLSPLNPIPSQLRYLQYISRRNVALQWPPLDRALTLDCIIFRLIPDFNGEGGCRPSFRIYGQDPLGGEDRNPKLLFSTQEQCKATRTYKQAESEIVKIDLNCNIQGDVVLECTSLYKDLEHEDMMFRIMFNTAFIRSNILMLNRDEIDTPWDTKDQFPKDFSAEVLFSDMDASASIVAANLSCFEENEGLPMEAFAKVQEFFSHVDWLESSADVAQSVIQKVPPPHSSSEHFDFATAPHAVNISPMCRSSHQKPKEEKKYYILCKSEDKDDQVFLCQKVSKGCNLAQLLQYQPREIAQTALCPETRMLSAASQSSAITKSPLTASGSKIPTLGSGPLPPPETLKQPSVDPSHEDTSVMARCLSEFSSPSENTLRKDPCFEMATSSLPSPPRSYVNPSRLESTLKSPSSPTLSNPPPPPPPPPPPLAAAAVPLCPPTLSLDEKSTNYADVYLPPLLDVLPKTSDKLEVIGTLSSQSLASPYKNSAAKSRPSPPPLPPASPLKENIGKSVPPLAPLPPQKSGSSRSFPAPPSPPPPRGLGLQSQQPQVTPSVPCAPPLPVGLNNGASKLATIPDPAMPLSSLNVKGRSISRSLVPKNSQTSKLKPLHWLKLTRAVQGSLWSETQKFGETSIAPEIDMSELENLFSASVPNSDQGTTIGKSKRGLGAPKSDIVQLVDHRRAYNCEIMLSKVKVPLKQLMAYILSLEDSSLDIDQVENLIKFCPTKEDMELLKGYKGQVDKLGKCEQLLLELMRVPRVEAKLRVFAFKMQFSNQASDLRKSLNIVNSAADQIRSSMKLKRIMQTVLSLGNALNQGTARGNAVGFRLDSLLKLTEIRARNNKMILMHYLCKVISEKLPELLDFSKDFASIESATKRRCKQLTKGWKRLCRNCPCQRMMGPSQMHFGRCLQLNFLSNFQNLKEFLYIAEAEGRNVDTLIVYFGEDPACCPFEQVVTTLLNFTRMFNRAHEENCKQLELEKKTERCRNLVQDKTGN
ncbi:formin-like protein 13 isoform X3 [Chenopodium quinoa]|uniref:formin-like protein 13 isoform X3 n=1 Tax=Chenopodium quinoa TaxID=63459 RepID=UPI000B77A21A|nr:formin-like protein 13 isoform X3 [Chenopodium quinoa]